MYKMRHVILGWFKTIFKSQEEVVMQHPSWFCVSYCTLSAGCVKAADQEQNRWSHCLQKVQKVIGLKGTYTQKWMIVMLDKDHMIYASKKNVHDTISYKNISFFHFHCFLTKPTFPCFTFTALVSPSGVKWPPFLWTLKPAKLGDLSRWRRYIVSVRTLGLRWNLCWDLSVVSVKAVNAAAEGLLCVERPGLVGLLLSASLLLPQ